MKISSLLVLMVLVATSLTACESGKGPNKPEKVSSSVSIN